MREPFSGIECLVIIAKPIPSNPTFGTTYCDIIGMSRDGKHISFQAPTTAFEEACKTPAQFMEVRDLRAPNAMLGDNGKPIVIG